MAKDATTIWHIRYGYGRAHGQKDKNGDVLCSFSPGGRCFGGRKVPMPTHELHRVHFTPWDKT